MISISKLEFGYKPRQPVIKGLNLELQMGEIHGIAGLNGSGKTTLLQLIFGLLKPQEGAISCSSFPLSKKVVSLLPVENHFYSFITAREYLSLFQTDGSDIENWNELFNIPLDQIIDEYSSGMKKKVAVLGIIIQDKPLVILDEPFNNLDIETNRLLREIFLRLKKQGTTIIVTSHIVETLTNLCDEIHYLEGGNIKLSCESKGFDQFQQTLYSKIEMKNRSKLDELMGE
jgi:ABC-2 type transport system ATP-binding protein